MKDETLHEVMARMEAAMKDNWENPEWHARYEADRERRRLEELDAEQAFIRRQLARFPERSVESSERIMSDPSQERWPVLKWALEAIKSEPWVKGESMLLAGVMGSGKTVTACVVARLFANAGRTAHYLPAYDAKDLQDEAKYRTLELAQLVVVDEVHRLGDNGAWIQSPVRGLIDKRYGARRNTIVIGSAAPAELVSILGAESIDRIHPDLMYPARDVVPETRSRRWRQERIA